jgi:CheY-like chemotaxis protein
MEEDPESFENKEKTVLVCDDDAGIRRLSRFALEETGYSVIEAEDGDDAIEKFTQNREKIDLIILDGVMPRMDGKEVYDHIAIMCPNARVLFMSGSRSEIFHEQQMLERPGFIRKPFSIADLLKQVTHMMSN